MSTFHMFDCSGCSNPTQELYVTTLDQEYILNLGSQLAEEITTEIEPTSQLDQHFLSYDIL